MEAYEATAACSYKMGPPAINTQIPEKTIGKIIAVYNILNIENHLLIKILPRNGLLLRDEISQKSAKSRNLHVQNHRSVAPSSFSSEDTISLYIGEISDSERLLSADRKTKLYAMDFLLSPICLPV